MTERRQLLQESLAAIERLEAKLEASERAKREPIAIIGAGCRYPGGIEDLDALWRVVRDGVDAVSDVPADRWDGDAYYSPVPNTPGKMISKRGGFLSQVDRFDPKVFGISPREAASLDPQQRLLLETAHEALESAGLPTDRLAGSSTGVFVGISTNDYSHMLRGMGAEHVDLYSATGGAFNAAAGRISFTYGFQGAAMAVDSACSSSLVAVHLACQSLRSGESDLALAGGVNAILTPDSIVLLSRWGMMAPDGTCKTFDAAADGFVRSEGCAVVALKRLSDAQAAGDPILAVIRGSAVNSDGRSSGLTVPNGPAQQAVLRKALASAGLAPADIDYVEAHGTGTSLGDPIEVEALGAVMKQGRPADRPLLLGSIKTNLGHTEAAAGLAGLLKLVMSLQHEAIPPTLHFKKPNPSIPWSDYPLAVATTLTPWPRGDRPRRAGVSSFGFTGTNAHVILEEAPPPAPAPHVAEGTAFLVPLSARDDASLRELALRTADRLAAAPTPSLADVAATASTGRAHLPRRLAALATTVADLERDLRAFASGDTPATVEHSPRAERQKIAFLFTGQGSQVAGMGRGLYESEPVFRATIDRAAAILQPLLPRPLLEVIYPPEGTATPLGDTAYTQPALFAIEVALAELWKSWGITPSIVIGHSVGEYAAACVAGVFSLEDGLALIAERGRLMGELPAGGGMAAIFAAEARVAPRLAPYAGRLSIAGVNGPDETVVSGDGDALAELLAGCAAEGIRAKALDVSHAFHSARLEPMLDALERRAASVTHAVPRIPLVSNLTGAPFPAGARPDAAYWRRHAREAVRFAAGIESLVAAGVTSLVEIGPQPILLGLAAKSAPGATWSTGSSLRRGRDDRRTMLATLAGLYTRGAPVAWDAVVAGRGRRVAGLPTTPFQRERHWLETPAAPKRALAAGVHPLLGERQRAPGPGTQFLAEISRDAPAFLADHVILGTVLLPGTAYVELALAAARALGASGTITLEGVTIDAPMALEAETTRLVHVTVEPEVSGRAPFVVRSARGDADPGEPWQVHARGALRRLAAETVAGAPPVADARGACADAVAVDAFYGNLERAGLAYGPAFRAVRTMFTGDRVAVGLLETAGGEGFVLHPAILDAAFHLLGAAVVATHPEGAADRVYLPIGIDTLQVTGVVPSRVWATASLRDAPAGAAVLQADLRLEDEHGATVAVISGLQLRAVTPQTLARALSLPGLATHTYDVRWSPVSPPAGAPARLEGRVVLVADRGGLAVALAAALSERGATCEVIPAAGADGETLQARLRGDGAPLTWVVSCDALDPSEAGPIEAARERYLRLLRLSQALAAVSPRAGLCLVTRGAQAIAPGDDVDPALAALLGLARTVAAERSEAPALRFDLDPATPPDVRPVLVALLGLSAQEPELGVRAGTLLAPRLQELARDRRAEAERDVVEVGDRGSLDALTVARRPRRAPEAGEVELAIRAAGLNFRDVLNALGLVPGFRGALGSECSGVITAVGPGVAGLELGDEVVALAGDSIASHVTVSAALVVRKPSSLGFADAVTLPNTYLTAAQSFLAAGGLRPGQRVLVHAAAGGVGLAAVRLARRAGAEVIATAGSPDKRAFVLAEGAAHVFDSRSASFADDVMRVTNGEGVDVVLNSLSNELIAAGMRVLGPGGCFIEIGKKGIWTPAEAAERAPRVRYHIVDLGEEIVRDVGSVRAMFEEVLRDVAAGELAPLPLRAFALGDAHAAFRYMATARHIGKVVLVPEANEDTLPVRRDGTYLVTGGLGGIGLAAARWLAERGAGELVLVGRRGLSPDEEMLLEPLRAAGARVTAVACDIGDHDAVAALWRDVLASRPPLRGVLHAAGVIADAPLAQQDEARFAEVERGKIRGAWHLHERTAGTPLDFFVCCSSSSALFGSPGQASYAAANAFLDGLAAYRRARGRVATSIAWGAWGEVGMAARMAEPHRARLARLGVGFLEPGEALAAQERALLTPAAHVAIVALDPPRFGAQGGPSVRALLGMRTEATAAATAAPAAPDSLAALRAARDASPADRLALVRPYVHQEAARVLGFNASALDAETPLSSLGFDSLMAVQFRNRVEADLALALPLAELLAGPTVAQLTEGIAARLGSAAPAVPTPAEAAWEEGSL